MKANSVLQVDCCAIKQNIVRIRQEIGPNTKLIPVLKGDAYGLGACALAQLCDLIGGIDTFAVSQISEGVELREAGIKQQILVMSLPLDFQLEEAIASDLVLTLGSFRQFPLLEDLSRKFRKKIPVSLKLDTGLHRIGFLPEETEKLCSALQDAREYLTIVGTFSHFSDTRKEKMKEQAACFDTFLCALREKGIDPGLCHISSSASIEASRDYLYDAVRIGRRLMLDAPNHPAGEIREAVSFHAYLADVKQRKAGEHLAYNERVTLQKDTRVGVLSIGYGDGLDPALADAHVPVLINGKRAVLLALSISERFHAPPVIPWRFLAMIAPALFFPRRKLPLPSAGRDVISQSG